MMRHYGSPLCAPFRAAVVALSFLRFVIIFETFVVQKIHLHFHVLIHLKIVTSISIYLGLFALIGGLLVCLLSCF